MNKDNAKDYLPLVQALAEGHIIQSRSNVTGEWYDLGKDVKFDHCDGPSGYRIKPEPREWNGIITGRRFHTSGPGECSFTMSIIGSEEHLPVFGETIRVREVID